MERAEEVLSVIFTPADLVSIWLNQSARLSKKVIDE